MRGRIPWFLGLPRILSGQEGKKYFPCSPWRDGKSVQAGQQKCNKQEMYKNDAAETDQTPDDAISRYVGRLGMHQYNLQPPLARRVPCHKAYRHATMGSPKADSK